MAGKIKKESCKLRKRQFLAAVAFSAVFLAGFFFVNVQEARANVFMDFLKFVTSPVTDTIESGFKYLIYGVFRLFAWFLGVAGTLFDWVIEPKNVYLVLDNPAIYESWKLVRDFMNLAFILTLLFSAFCTIFQVEKYHLKKILLTVFIMALLVNFSYPISRFIIDVSNVMFYFIINSMLPDKAGNGILANFADYSAITEILNPKSAGLSIGDSEVTYLLAICAFTFILMLTFMVLAVMFVIRLTVLGILIILSPAGFVGAIFPSTKHYADDWWSNLFKYSFFAPIMAFIMATSLNVMKHMNEKSAMQTFLEAAGQNAPGATDANFFGSMAFFAIPIIILWVGLSVAQKLSIAGAGAVVGRAKKVASWAGKAPFRRVWWGAKKVANATGIPGGIKLKVDNVLSKMASRQAEKEAIIAGKGPFAVPGAVIRNAESRAAEYEKSHESDASLKARAQKGDAGAALVLVKRGKMDDSTYGDFTSNNKEASVREYVAKKLKKNRVDILIAHKQKDANEKSKATAALIASGISSSSITPGMINSYIEREELGNLSPEEIKTQYWNTILSGASPQTKKNIRKMFAGLTDDALKEIGKAMSKNNRSSIDALRSGGIF